MKTIPSKHKLFSFMNVIDTAYRTKDAWGNKMVEQIYVDNCNTPHPEFLAKFKFKTDDVNTKPFKPAPKK